MSARWRVSGNAPAAIRKATPRPRRRRLCRLKQTRSGAAARTAMRGFTSRWKFRRRCGTPRCCCRSAPSAAAGTPTTRSFWCMWTVCCGREWTPTTRSCRWRGKPITRCICTAISARGWSVRGCMPPSAISGPRWKSCGMTSGCRLRAWDTWSPTAGRTPPFWNG